MLVGMGLCFLPEFNSVLRGVQTRALVDPVVGHRFGPALRDLCRLFDAAVGRKRPSLEDMLVACSASEFSCAK